LQIEVWEWGTDRANGVLKGESSQFAILGKSLQVAAETAKSTAIERESGWGAENEKRQRNQRGRVNESRQTVQIIGETVVSVAQPGKEAWDWVGGHLGGRSKEQKAAAQEGGTIGKVSLFRVNKRRSKGGARHLSRAKAKIPQILVRK